MSAPNQPDKMSRASAGQPLLRLPDATVCRAKLSGIGDLIYCLVNHPQFCSHRLSFGHALFCLHPQAKDIAARTEASPRA